MKAIVISTGETEEIRQEARKKEAAFALVDGNGLPRLSTKASHFKLVWHKHVFFLAIPFTIIAFRCLGRTVYLHSCFCSTSQHIEPVQTPESAAGNNPQNSIMPVPNFQTNKASANTSTAQIKKCLNRFIEVERECLQNTLLQRGLRLSGE